MIKLTLKLFVFLSFIQAASATSIVQFTPQNLTETTNQIRVAFSDKMVPLGVDLAADIFNIKCTPAMAGTARWQDEKTWAFDFKTVLFANKVPGGTSCQVELKKSVRDFKGQPVTGRSRFDFQVDGPNLLSIYPGEVSGRDESEIQEDQVFLLSLDGEVDRGSLNHAYFKVDGVASPVSLKILSESEKQTLLKSEEYLNNDFGGDVVSLAVQAKTRFPAGRKVSFVWGAGIRAEKSSLARRKNLVLPFKTREALTAQVSCTRENAKADCSPLEEIQLTFSAPVATKLVEKITMTTAQGLQIKGKYNPGNNFTDAVSFPASYLENQNFTITLPKGIQDDAGRELSNSAQFPVTIKTAGLPPLAKFSGDFGLLEQASPYLPVTLRHLKSQTTAGQGRAIHLDGASPTALVAWMKRLDRKLARARNYEARDQSIFSATDKKTRAFKLSAKQSDQQSEVVGIELKKPGLHIVEVQSQILGQSLLGVNAPMYVSAGALVTNMVVHSKWGRENSLFWVTRLSDAGVVAGAKVSVVDCRGKSVWSGKTDAQGRAFYKGELKKLLGKELYCQTPDAENVYSEYDRGFFVFAQHAGDVTFTHSSWTDGIEAWRFGEISSSSPAYNEPSMLATTVLDRTLLHAGSTVSMKHYIRSQTMNGFKKVAVRDLPTHLLIRNYDSDTEYSLPLKWDTGGTAISEFKIPKDAKLGRYSLQLQKKTGKTVSATYSSSSFQVSEFQVPLMKGLITFAGEAQKMVQPGKLPAQLSVTYQDGGPAKNESVSFRYTIDRMYGVFFPAYSGVNFGMAPVQEGKINQASIERENEKSVQVALKLDAQGAAQYSIPDLKNFDTPRTLTTQLEFTDKNSELQTVSRSVKLYPSGRLVGVKVDEPYNSGRKIEFQIAVVDVNGQPQSGVSPDIQIFSENTFSHRTRMVGGFYNSENFTEYKRLKTPVKCSGLTDARGFLNCEIQTEDSGTFIIQAKVQDSSGNTSFGRQSVYVTGEKRAWYPAEASDRMDLLLADRQVKSGQDAKLEVKMPFADANVLVTIEREGILDSFVTKLSTRDPVIRVPIKSSYAPNVFVSVMAMRGRSGGSGPLAVGEIDLGKPAYKMGMTAINVDWDRHRLNVEVKPKREIYKPREAAEVLVKVTDSSGEPVVGAEFALAVVDEGLLELSKNSTWDLLKQMMNPRSLEVETSTAQMQVVGKRHFGLKARPVGGDGGLAPTRELFDTLVFWKARLKTGPGGVLKVPFTMNDSLTKFRIVAVASQGLDKFGTGEATVLAKQDLVIIPSLSQFVRSGDQFRAEFTVRNTTQSSKTVKLSGRAHFNMGVGKSESQDLPLKTVKLEPMGSALVDLGLVTLKSDVKSMKLGVSVQGEKAKAVIDACSKAPAEVARQRAALDNICLTPVVKAAVPVRTWMAQLSRLTKEGVSVNLDMPKEALRDQGGIQVSLLGSLAGSFETIKSCVEEYPFHSLEYFVSRAVTLKSRSAWNEAMKMLPSHLDAEGLVMYYPSRTYTYGSDSLTGYILSLSQLTGFEIPSGPAQRMVTALTAFVEGRSKSLRAQPKTPAEIFVRRLSAIEVLARRGEANPLWLTSLPEVASEQVPTQAVIDQLSIYTTLKGLPGASSKIVELMKVLDGRMVRTGRSYKLIGDRFQCHCDLASHDVDQLRMILVLTSSPALRKIFNDALPKMVVGALELMRRGAWDLTVANAYGVLAMHRYAQAFEKTNVNGLTTASLNPGFAQSLDWNLPVNDNGGLLNFGWKNPGQHKLDLTHQGMGIPWAVVALQAAVPVTKKIESHIQLDKSVSPSKTKWKRGEVATVTLKIKTQGAFSQVALIDPIPAGAKIIEVREDLGRYPDFQELASDSYRANYGSLAPDEFTVVYQIRLGNTGTFQIPSTRIEALYSPENFAEFPGQVWTVEPE